MLFTTTERSFTVERYAVDWNLSVRWFKVCLLLKRLCHQWSQQPAIRFVFHGRSRRREICTLPVQLRHDIHRRSCRSLGEFIHPPHAALLPAHNHGTWQWFERWTITDHLFESSTTKPSLHTFAILAYRQRPWYIGAQAQSFLLNHSVISIRL